MKKQLLLILFLSSLFLNANSRNIESKRDSIVIYAHTLLKTPYLWGGTSTKGFDCSGFLYYVYKKYKIKVSRTSSGYINKGNNIELKKVKPADVLLFTGTDSSNRKIGHIGMVVSNTDGVIDFIHASSSKKHFGVTITRYNNSGYTKRFIKAISII